MGAGWRARCCREDSYVGTNPQINRLPIWQSLRRSMVKEEADRGTITTTVTEANDGGSEAVGDEQPLDPSEEIEEEESGDVEIIGQTEE